LLQSISPAAVKPPKTHAVSGFSPVKTAIFSLKRSRAITCK
jgi:hypothetical protein